MNWCIDYLYKACKYLMHIKGNPSKRLLIRAVFEKERIDLIRTFKYNYNLKWIRDSRATNKAKRLEEMGYILQQEDKDDPVKFCDYNIVMDPM